MDQLAQMFPQMDPSSMGAAAGFNMADQQIIARQNAGLNQQMALQDIFQQEQMNPLKVKNQQLTNEGLVASNKESDMRTRKGLFELDEAERLKEPKYQSMLAKLRGETSEAELKQTHARIEQEMLSPDPKVRNRALGMYKMTGDMIKMYEQEKERRTTSYGVASIGQKGQSDRAAAKEDKGRNFVASLDKHKKATEKYSALVAEMGLIGPSDPMYATYAQMAQNLLPQVQEEANKGAGNIVETIGPDGKKTYGIRKPTQMAPNVPMQPSPAAASRPQRQTAPKTPQEARSAGWVLKMDAAGNKAYVGPNNEILEIK